MKKYLMSGVAAIAFLAAFTSCSKSTDLYDQGAVDQKKTEEKTTDFSTNFANKVATVNPNQDWNLFADYSASITIKAGFAENYTVGIYTDNPLFNKNANCLALKKANEGETVTMSFTGGKELASVFVGVYDAKGHGKAYSINVENGKINATIGGTAAATRASEATSSFAKSLNDYLNPTGATVVSIEAMKNYTAITNDIIANETSNKNHTLSDMSWYYSPAAYPAGGDGKHYRVETGTEITEVFNINATYGVINDAVIYIEGKVHLNGNTLNGPTLVVAAGGEIIIDGNTNMSNAGRIIVMAGGKISGTDGVEFNVNNGAACYNAGEIKFKGQLNVNGSDTYNNNVIEVDVLRNTTAGGSFTNFGKITARTNKQAADAYNSTIINGCYMHFTEDAGIGTLTLLDNSRLDVDGRAEFNMNTQTLYNLSEINANEIWVNSTTFAGPTGSGTYAVVKTNKIWANQGGDLKASGNTYFDWNIDNLVNHIGALQTLDNPSSIKGIIRAQNFNYVNEETAPDDFFIPKGECTGNGYNDGGNGGGEIPNTTYYTVAFEDLGSTDDFDFNDIVLEVAKNNDTGATTVECVAQGGILEVDVAFKGTVLFSHTDGQMHTNRGSYGGPSSISFAGVSDLQSFSLKVKEDNGTSTVIESATVTGKAPQALIIPNKWKWPTERTNIVTAYPDFASWVKDVTNNEWYNNPVSGKVVE